MNQELKKHWPPAAVELIEKLETRIDYLEGRITEHLDRLERTADGNAKTHSVCPQGLYDAVENLCYNWRNK